MNGNLTKPQKKALNMIPRGIHSESDLVDKGVSKSQLISLSSKNALLRQVSGKEVKYLRQ